MEGGRGREKRKKQDRDAADLEGPKPEEIELGRDCFFFRQISMVVSVQGRNLII